MKTKLFLRLAFVAFVMVLHAGPVAAQIYWQNGQFVIDQFRPGWQGAVANLNVAGWQSRNHIIAFEVIQNDLAFKLNRLRANNMQQGDINNFVALTEALFINGPNGEVQAMRQARANLLQAIQQNNQNNFQVLSQTLLGLLNSSSANVRVGNAALNTAIGYSIDAEFSPGLANYNGPALTAQGQVQFNGPVLRLTPHTNAIVYRYQAASGLALSFVVNGIHGAQNQAAPNGVQLSSTMLPQIPQNQLPNQINPQPYPVLVTDPANNGAPFLFR